MVASLSPEQMGVQARFCSPDGDRVEVEVRVPPSKSSIVFALLTTTIDAETLEKMRALVMPDEAGALAAVRGAR
jgi:hypothetical protein